MVAETTESGWRATAVATSRAVVWLSAACVAAGVAWRFATLGEQSYWYDEAYTVDLVRMSFVGTLKEIPQTESTPPLYYVLAWLWGHLFGTGEAGLRSLSACFGVATIGVAYVLGRRLGGTTVAAVAAALVAVNPLLIWYSQEARAYELLVLLTAASLVFVIRADEGRRTVDHVLWAVLAALALLTHYFALFFVVGEVGWLLARRRGRTRAAYASAAGVGLVGAALLPLALYQRKNPYVFSDDSIIERAAQVPKQFAVSWDAPHEYLLGSVAVLLLLVPLVVLTRSRYRSRGNANVLTLLAVVAATSLVIPFAAVAVGVDYINTRNVLAALVPILVIAGLGYCATRMTLVAAAGTVLIAVVANVSVAQDPAFQRTDYRGAVRSLPELTRPRLLVLAMPDRQIRIYAPNSHLLRGSARTDQIAFFSDRDEPARAFRPPKGFRLVRSRDVQQLSVRVFESRRPRILSARSLASRVRTGEPANVLLQAPDGG